MTSRLKISSLDIEGFSNGPDLAPQRSNDDSSRTLPRQTLPAVFPKENERNQMVNITQDINFCGERLDSTYMTLKKQIQERQSPLSDVLVSQFASINRHLNDCHEEKKGFLQSLLKSPSGDIQTSAIAGTLYTGQNGHTPPSGAALSREDLNQLNSFNLLMAEYDLQKMSEFTRPFKGLFAAPRMDLPVDFIGKGYHQYVNGDFNASSVWSNYKYSPEDLRTMSESFSSFELPSKQNGMNASFHSTSFSSGYNNQEYFNGPYGVPMSPFTTMNKSFSFEPHPILPSLPNSDFFNSPPRALHGLPEYSEDQNVMRNQENGNLVQPWSSQGMSSIHSLPKFPVICLIIIIMLMLNVKPVSSYEQNVNNTYFLGIDSGRIQALSSLSKSIQGVIEESFWLKLCLGLTGAYFTALLGWINPAIMWILKRRNSIYMNIHSDLPPESGSLEVYGSAPRFWLWNGFEVLGGGEVEKHSVSKKRWFTAPVICTLLRKSETVMALILAHPTDTIPLLFVYRHSADEVRNLLHLHTVIPGKFTYSRLAISMIEGVPHLTIDNGLPISFIRNLDLPLPVKFKSNVSV